MYCLKKFAYAALVITMIVSFAVSVQAAEWKGWNIHVAGYPNTIAWYIFNVILPPDFALSNSANLSNAIVFG